MKIRVAIATIIGAFLFCGVGPVQAAVTPLDFAVNMNEATVVDTTGGTPRIAINVGGVTRYASYAAGSGTATLTFTYTPVAGDVDLNGVALTSPVDLNGGTMKDAAGNDATLTFTLPNTASVNVDYPSLGLDFLADADGRYTLSGTAYNDLGSFLTAAGGSFARTSTATYYDVTGTIQTAAANVPRFDYHPVTHAARGLLIEELRTNLLIRSAEFNDASWLKTGSTVTANATTAPDGTLSADKLVGNNGVNTRKSVYRTFAATSGIKYSYTMYLKKAERTTASIWFDQTFVSEGAYYGSGVLLDLNAGTSAAPAIVQVTPVGNDWYRCTVSATPTATGPFIVALTIGPPSGADYTGDGVAGIYMWGGQVEAGTVPTSYIPTAGTAVTREYDNLSLPSGAWTSGTAGTFLLQAPKARDQGVASRYYSFTGGNGQVSLINTTGVTGYVTDIAGTAVVALPSAVLTTDSALRHVIAYQANDFSQSVNGGAVQTDNAGTFPALTGLSIGNNAVSGPRAINGPLQKLNYYPVRIPDAQLPLMVP